MLGFIVDFYCPQLRLVLELDGAGHFHPNGASYDAARTALLDAGGYLVRRIRNRDLSRDYLENLLLPLVQSAPSPAPDRERGQG